LKLGLRRSLGAVWVQNCKMAEELDLNDFLNILQEAALIYHATDDWGSAKGFKGAYWAIRDYLEGLEGYENGAQFTVSHELLTAEDPNIYTEIFDLRGVGASTKQMLLEWAEDGECERMETLREKNIEINRTDPWFAKSLGNEYAFHDD